MNERIKQLAKQAGMTNDKFGMFFANDKHNEDGVDLQKFAELIVQECTGLLYEEAERLYTYSSECDNVRDSDEAELCAEKCMDNIKMIEEHFGVE